MRRTSRQVPGIGLALLLVAAPGAARASDACERACGHMRDTSAREMAKTPGFTAEQRKSITDKLKADEAASMTRCNTRCQSGRFDPACVLRSATTTEFVGCMGRAPGAAPATSGAAPSLGAVAPPAAHALPRAERDKILSALGHVPAENRVDLLGLALTEADPSAYGADLLPAFRALFEAPPERRRLAMLRALQMPLTLMGCGRATAETMRLAPGGQSKYLAGHCPMPALPRLFTEARASGAKMEHLLLALVLQQRAQAGGIETDPLHQRAVEVLLAR